MPVLYLTQAISIYVPKVSKATGMLSKKFANVLEPIGTFYLSHPNGRACFA